MSSRQVQVLRWPALPVLTDFMNTLVAKAVVCAREAVTGVTFLQKHSFVEAHVEVADEPGFKNCIADVIRTGGEQMVEQKAMLLTIGMAGDTRQMERVAKELGFSLAQGKGYNQIAELAKNLAEQYARGQVEISDRWRMDVRDKVEVRLEGREGKGYPLPSLVRSVSLYEGGKFSGFRDVRASGSLSKGVFEARCDAAWWILTLAAAGASLVTVERAQRENRYVFMNFEPLYGVRYEGMHYYKEFLEGVENFLRQTGLFVEDEELFRLSLLFHMYSVLSSPWIPPRFGIKLRSIRAVGKRFTEAYVTSIAVGEVKTLYHVLQMYPGDAVRDTREAAEACAELGRYVMKTMRAKPTMARELSLDVFAARLKVLMRALSEPGYVPLSESLYDLLRMMRVEDWRKRFIKSFADWLSEQKNLESKEAERKAKEKLDEAKRKAKEKLDMVTKLASTVASSLR